MKIDEYFCFAILGIGILSYARGRRAMHQGTTSLENANKLLAEAVKQARAMLEGWQLAKEPGTNDGVEHASDA